MALDPLIDELASDTLGPAKQQAANTASPDANATEEGGEQQTVAEQATELAAPNDQGTDTELDSVIFDVEFGEGKKRKLTPKQIASTFDRYSKLNSQWQNEVAPMSPVLELAKKIMADAQAQGHQITGDQLAGFLSEAARSYSSIGGNPDSQEAGEQGNEMSDDDLSKWEEENAITLPPGFRNSNKQISELKGQINNLTNMLQQVIQAQQGVAQAATQTANNAQMDQAAAIKQTISNNLNSAQAFHQLPDEAENDFFEFAASRGYTIEDFVDPHLTNQVVGDFKANMNTPEMERLREIAKRRQAYTGSTNSTASNGGSGPADNPDAAFFSEMVNHVAQR